MGFFFPTWYASFFGFFFFFSGSGGGYLPPIGITLASFPIDASTQTRHTPRHRPTVWLYILPCTICASDTNLQHQLAVAVTVIPTEHGRKLSLDWPSSQQELAFVPQTCKHASQSRFLPLSHKWNGRVAVAGARHCKGVPCMWTTIIPGLNRPQAMPAAWAFGSMGSQATGRQCVTVAPRTLGSLVVLWVVSTGYMWSARPVGKFRSRTAMQVMWEFSNTDTHTQRIWRQYHSRPHQNKKWKKIGCTLRENSLIHNAKKVIRAISSPVLLTFIISSISIIYHYYYFLFL